MAKIVLMISALSGMLAVGLGAFGAHALKERLSINGLESTYQTAVQYHFYHTLALLVVGLLLIKYPNQWLNFSSYSTMAGIILFSGSLYALAISGVRWLGAITPLGGLCFILGWIFLLWGVWKIEL